MVEKEETMTDYPYPRKLNKSNIQAWVDRGVPGWIFISGPRGILPDNNFTMAIAEAKALRDWLSRAIEWAQQETGQGSGDDIGEDNASNRNDVRKRRG
jgi:hypothetical protein